jgi:group I intron endonuclease
MDKCGVYVIRCEPTGSRYVGYSVHVVKRIREHFYRLEKGVHRNRRLKNAYDEYGKDSFRSEVLLYCDPTNVELYGKQLIGKLHPEFNIVHNGHKRIAWTKILGPAFKDLICQIRFNKKLEKTLERIQKRTHRL